MFKLSFQLVEVMYKSFFKDLHRFCVAENKSDKSQTTDAFITLLEHNSILNLILFVLMQL